MIIIRIPILSLLFVLFTSALLPISTTNDAILQNWQTTCLAPMSSEQLQFTANFLYLSYAIALAELKIQQFTTPIARLNQSIRTKISTHKNVTDDLAMLKTLIERLTYVVGARTIYIETLNTCINDHDNKKGGPMIDSIAGHLIDNALESIQLDAQTRLRTWADEKFNETARQLKKSSEVMSATSQYFGGISKLHKEMSEGILPIELSKENEYNKSIIIFDTIIRNNHALLTIAENAIAVLNETSDNASQIIAAGAEIYKKYYMTVYNIITASTFDKYYATTMFGMHDVLPKEYKSLLPDPDHVFEHMLQTTKLYTQVELLQ
jgi:hypothetical protein